MKRILPRLVAALAMVTMTLATASADPYSDLKQSEKKFYALKTWHATLTTAGQTFSMDFVSPDRMREVMSRGMALTVIGRSGWMQVGGQTHPLPPPMMAMFQSRVQTIRTLGLEGDLAKNYTVTFTGMRTLNGMATRTYHLVKKSDRRYTIDWWISTVTNLPLEALVNVDGKSATILYSAFNSAITISGP